MFLEKEMLMGCDESPLPGCWIAMAEDRFEKLLLIVCGRV